MANGVISPAAFFTKTIGIGAHSTDYHRGYLFQVILKDILGLSVQDTSLITYFVANSQSPVETTGIINVDWMNSQTKIGGRTLYEAWSITVRDDAKSKAYEYFKKWRRLVYETSSGQSSLPRDYKQPVDLYLLDNRGNHERGYKLVNAWPGSIGQMTLDYSTENIVTFPITINYDEFVPLGAGDPLDVGV
jgi:hypothetical protein